MPLALLLGVLAVFVQVEGQSGHVTLFLLLSSGAGLALQARFVARGRSRDQALVEASSDPQCAAVHAGGAAFALRSTLTGVVLGHAPGAEVIGLALALHIDGELPDRFFGDAQSVAAIVGALVTNALAATESGGVRVEVSRAQLASGSTVAIEVEDTGAGFSAERLAAGFGSTSGHGHPGAPRGVDGDFGPARCRELVEALGGSLRVRSKMDCGSTFRVELPLVPQPAAALPSRAAAHTAERLAA